MHKILPFLLALGCVSLTLGAQNPNRPAISAAAHLKTQMAFTENKGQLRDAAGNAVPDVLFKSEGTGPQVYITTSGMSFVFAENAKGNHASETATEKQTSGWSKVEMNLAGASIRKENIVCENALPGVSNYYYAHCPQGILGVKSFQKITIKNIYPGIDWIITADNTKGMAHDFLVHAGADPAQIRLLYTGMDQSKLQQDEKGRLSFVSEYGTLFEGGLEVYEKESGRRIQSGFDIFRDTYKCSGCYCRFVPTVSVAYKLAAFSADQTLLIDPPLQWSMPQTSSDLDYGYAISAVHDGSGDVFVCGSTAGTDFPVLNAYQGQLFGFSDMVIERLNSAGARVWSTYYGGTDDEAAKGIASDAAGNCYVTGNTTSADFPVQNPLQSNPGTGNDLAIVKLNGSGARQFASWYGSFGNEFGMAVAADAAGNFYITGYTSSQFFLVPNATVQATKDAGYDAFIMKLDPACTIQWATFYGGDDDDKARAIAIDASGSNIFITGSTMSGTFPSSAGVFQPYSVSAYNYEDAFIVKMSTSQVVQFSTFCGAADADFGQGITVDNNGNIFVTGYTLSANFPIVNPGNGAYVDSTQGSIGTHDAFVTECNSTGTTRMWSSYFGGSGVDMGLAIASDPFVGFYICGNTASTDFPLHQPSDLTFYQATQGDGGSFNDMFIAWFDANDSLRWSTYYGDAMGNEAYGICVDANDNIFVTGVDDNDLGVLKFNPGFPTNVATQSFDNENFIYPNPASETLFMDLGVSNEGVYALEMVNAQGQLVSKETKTLPAGNTTLQLDVKTLAKGLYLLKVYSPEGKVLVKRFVKE